MAGALLGGVVFGWSVWAYAQAASRITIKKAGANFIEPPGELIPESLGVRPKDANTVETLVGSGLSSIPTVADSVAGSLFTLHSLKVLLRQGSMVRVHPRSPQKFLPESC